MRQDRKYAVRRRPAAEAAGWLEAATDPDRREPADARHLVRRDPAAAAVLLAWRGAAAAGQRFPWIAPRSVASVVPSPAMAAAVSLLALLGCTPASGDADRGLGRRRIVRRVLPSSARAGRRQFGVERARSAVLPSSPSR